MANDIYAKLGDALGAKRVIVESDRLDAYARDESRLGRFPPKAAVLCESHDEVVFVLRLAAEHKVPVTPRGTGTGKTGGALAIKGGIVLSTAPMNAIKEINADDLVAVVQPGVITGVLQAAVEEQNLFYAPDPASLDMCSLGGNVATNAGGPRAFKYGVTRDWTLGAQVVTMGGQSHTFGRRTQKGVTGYDMTGLFVGSEGTLGIATEITLKLIGKPEATGTLLAVMPDAETAGKAVGRVIAGGFHPRAIELLDKTTIDHVRPHAPYKLPADAGAALLIELDGRHEHMLSDLEVCGALCEAAGAQDVLVARDDADRQRIWQTRRLCSQSLTNAHRFKLSEDIVVPLGSIAQMFKRLAVVATRHGILLAAYGHAGDGNLHVNILTDEDPEDPEVKTRIHATIDDVFRETLALKGSLSGEHGIGIAKSRFMPWEQAPPLLKIQKDIKRLFDPLDLMNPGKIFPD